MSWWLLLTLWLPSSIWAHPLAPVAVSVDQRGEDVTLSVKRSRVQFRGAAPRVRIPQECEAQGDPTRRDEASAQFEVHHLRCPASLVGVAFGVDGLSDAGVDALISVALEDGRVERGLLDRSDDAFVVPDARSGWEAAAALFHSGLRHLLGGLDHVLFVLGLALLVRRPRRVLIALTAFTAGHGLAMLGAVLHWTAVPSVFAELGIAATLLLLARQLVRERPEAARVRGAYLAALGVGAIHGLAFATAFASVSAPAAAATFDTGLAFALGAFHLGIEAGQLAVVLATLGALRILKGRAAAWQALVALVIGSFAMVWVVDALRTLSG